LRSASALNMRHASVRSAYDRWLSLESKVKRV